MNRTIRFTYRASPTLMMPSSSTTSFIAPSTSSKSEVGHFHVSPFVFLFVCIASLFSFCLFKRWCQSVSFSEQSQNHIERGFSWPTLSYTQLQSVSTKPCLILSLCRLILIFLWVLSFSSCRYGYLTNTKVKFILVTTDLDVRDTDVRNVRVRFSICSDTT